MSSPSTIPFASIGATVSNLEAKAKSGLDKVKTFSNNLDQKYIPKSLQDVRKVSGGEAPNPEQDAKNKQWEIKNQNKVVDRTNYKDISGNLNSLEYDRKISAIEQARKLRNPLSASTPALALTAHSAKLIKLENNIQFQQLDDAHKERVLQHFFNTFTSPILKANGIEAPTFENWVEGRRQTEPTAKPNASDYDRYLEGANIGIKFTLDFVKGALSYKLPWMPKTTSDLNAAAAKRISDAANGLSNINQEWHSTFNVKPSVTGWLASMAGNLVGSGPLYILADAATGGTAEIPEIAKLFSVGIKTAKALNYMREAGEFFSIDKTAGRSTKEAVTDATVTPLLGLGLNSALKGAGTVAGAARDRILKILNMKGTQTGVWGEPLTHTVSDVADKAENVEQSIIRKPRALVSSTDPDVRQAANNEALLRRQLAEKYYPEKAEDGKSVWRNLSKEQRAKIRTHISAMTQASTEVMPLAAPKLQTLANENSLDKWALESPDHKAISSAVAKLTGLNPAEVLTEVQAAQAAGTLNLNSPTQHLVEGLKPDVEREYEPGEGASATLRPNYTVSFKNAKEISTEDLSNKSGAEDFINGTIKYLPKSVHTKSGRLYFEHPEHHLLYISRLSDAPAPVKAKATVLLKNEFNRDIDQINTRAGWLREHVKDVQKNVKQIPQKGNIFRSTNLSQRSRYGTRAQNLLYNRDSLKTQITDLRELLKIKPKLKRTIAPMLKQLYLLKNAGAKPNTVAAREAAIQEVVKGLKRVGASPVTKTAKNVGKGLGERYATDSAKEGIE